MLIDTRLPLLGDDLHELQVVARVSSSFDVLIFTNFGELEAIICELATRQQNSELIILRLNEKGTHDPIPLPTDAKIANLLVREVCIGLVQTPAGSAPTNSHSMKNRALIVIANAVCTEESLSHSIAVLAITMALVPRETLGIIFQFMESKACTTFGFIEWFSSEIFSATKAANLALKAFWNSQKDSGRGNPTYFTPDLVGLIPTMEHDTAHPKLRLRDLKMVENQEIDASKLTQEIANDLVKQIETIASDPSLQREIESKLSQAAKKGSDIVGQYKKEVKDSLVSGTLTATGLLRESEDAARGIVDELGTTSYPEIGGQMMHDRIVSDLSVCIRNLVELGKRSRNWHRKRILRLSQCALVGLVVGALVGFAESGRWMYTWLGGIAGLLLAALIFVVYDVSKRRQFKGQFAGLYAEFAARSKKLYSEERNRIMLNICKSVGNQVRRKVLVQIQDFLSDLRLRLLNIKAAVQSLQQLKNAANATVRDKTRQRVQTQGSGGGESPSEMITTSRDEGNKRYRELLFGSLWEHNLFTESIRLSAEGWSISLTDYRQRLNGVLDCSSSEVRNSLEARRLLAAAMFPLHEEDGIKQPLRLLLAPAKATETFSTKEVHRHTFNDTLLAITFFEVADGDFNVA